MLASKIPLVKLCKEGKRLKDEDGTMRVRPIKFLGKGLPRGWEIRQRLEEIKREKIERELREERERWEDTQVEMRRMGVQEEEGGEEEGGVEQTQA